MNQRDWNHTARCSRMESMYFKLSASQRRRNKKYCIRGRKRYCALSERITLQQISDFDCKLVPVAYGMGTCWLPLTNSRSGSTKAYGRMRFNGENVLTHRFALAVKLGCTLWDLEGYDASHAPVSVCMGGMCCSPEHLTKKMANPNRSWDRIKDGLSGHRKARPELVPLMYPVGIYSDGKMFDETWQSNASPELIRFLEMGIKAELAAMHENYALTA
jgi:hypothetical protein